MALRSGGRKLSFDILAADEYADLMSSTAILRSHSDPPPLQNGAAASSPPRKRKKRKSRKGKSSLNSESPTAETSVINGDVNYSCTLSTLTEDAALIPDLDSEVQQVTLSSVFGALRQRNVGNGVSGGTVEANSDDSGSSKKDDVAKEEVAENWSGCGKESGQQGPEMNGRKLEKDGTLDWKEWMANDPTYMLPTEKSPMKYFLEEVYAGNSLRSTTTLGNDKERERVYDTIFRLPWRCELLINIGFFVCFDSFLSLLTIMPTRIIMVFWKLIRTRQFKRPSSAELSDFGCFIALIIGVTLLQQADISLIYHMIRGQGIIKLYVVYNVLEVFDKLCQSFGGDVMQALFNSADGLANCSPENMQFWVWRFVSDEALAVASSVIHSFILLAQAITLSTCIVAHNNALFAMLVSNNFAEIKSNVFKRYSKDNVQSLVYFDSVERFHITAFVLFVLAQNILEGESLPAVQKHLKLDQDAAKFRVQKEVLKFLAVQGLFSSSLGTEVTSFELQEKFRWPKSAIPSALAHMCIEQLQLLLANAQKGEGLNTVASGVEAKDLGSYFMRFLGILYNIPSVSLSRALNSDDEKAFKKLQAMESQLSKEERNCATTDASKLHALRYLLIQLLLQIILRPGEFFEAACEVVMCCKKAFVSSDLEFSGEDEPDGDGAPELMDVLVDTMLSLLPQSSAPLRSAIEQVFKCFCKNITDDGLHRMLRVVKKDLKPARHHNTDSEDDDGEDLLGLEEAEESDEAETGETVDSDQQTDESEAVVGVDAVTAQLPDASDDESDEGMDDDAMFRMDTYLARIFREKKNQAGGETAHSQLVLFKLRVLSLLEMYLHENPGKPQVIKVFSNLAQAFTNPQTTEGSEQLSQRIWGIIQKKIFKAKEYPKGETVSVAVLEPLLEKYLKLAAKPFKRKKSASNPSKKKQSASWSRHRMINSLARSSTFWILKIIDASNFSESELQRVCDILQNILVDYFDSKKSQMKCEFLKEIFRRRPWIGKQLFGFLLEKCSCAKSQFRQVEALDLVTEVLKSHSSASEKASEKFLKSHIPKLSHLIKHLVTNMPEKQARRAGVRKFCGKVFQILTTFKLNSSFVDALEADGCTACQSQLGDAFLALTKQEV